LYITFIAAALGFFVRGNYFVALVVLAFPSGFLGFYLMSSLFVEEKSGTQ